MAMSKRERQAAIVAGLLLAAAAGIVAVRDGGGPPADAASPPPWTAGDDYRESELRSILDQQVAYTGQDVVVWPRRDHYWTAAAVQQAIQGGAKSVMIWSPTGQGAAVVYGEGRGRWLRPLDQPGPPGGAGPPAAGGPGAPGDAGPPAGPPEGGVP